MTIAEIMQQGTPVRLWLDTSKAKNTKAIKDKHTGKVVKLIINDVKFISVDCTVEVVPLNNEFNIKPHNLTKRQYICKFMFDDTLWKGHIYGDSSRKVHCKVYKKGV